MDPAAWISSIRTAPADDFWLWTLLMLVAGFACGYGVFYYIRRARIMEDTPTSRIRSAPQGYIELVGTIQYLVNQPVSAPLTNSLCAWFSFTIEKKTRSYTSKGSTTRWQTVETQFSERPFQCVDETGTCMINPKGAEVFPSQEDIWYGSSKWPKTGPVEKSSFLQGGSYRYTEKRLHASDPLYAIGNFLTVDPNKARGDTSDEVRAILNIWKQDQETLLQQFDVNNDGQIDMQEWDDVRDAAVQHAMQQRLNRADRPAINILSKTDDFRRPYILSVKPQSDMVKRFRYKSIACTVGFVSLAPISLWMLFIRLGG